MQDLAEFEPQSKAMALASREYFSAYESLDVHELMLKDKPRTLTYRAAIRAAVLHCKATGVEPVVLDVGAGSGILSMFAAQVSVCSFLSACSSWLG